MTSCRSGRFRFNGFLFADSEFRDHVAIAIRIMRLQVIQQAAAFTYQHQKTPPGSVILHMRLEMLGQFANPLTQDRNLDFGGTGVRIVRPEALN
jgi:hypothetical protein